MGFFKKLFRGVKKVFKKVGKGIKKVVGKVGKFMNKIGIVGQIAMSFLLPGIGGLIGKAAGAMMASSNAVIAGAGNFLNAAVNIATKAGSMVKSVGDGVMKVVGQTVGTAINQIPGAGKFIKGFTFITIYKAGYMIFKFFQMFLKFWISVHIVVIISKTSI